MVDADNGTFVQLFPDGGITAGNDARDFDEVVNVGGCGESD
ncbi:hypothetical protein OHA40_06275 [Nocardia sp. NBC_00508]|nr:hypothetical protein [Nocardia sp. NBC_00508]WUD67732.1 hypothetical protein OHA40_06275 [Nocardia sp. NBC_00508]